MYKVKLEALAKEFEVLNKKLPNAVGIGLAISPALILWGYKMGIKGYDKAFNRFLGSAMGEGDFKISDMKNKNKGSFLFYHSETEEEKKLHRKTNKGSYCFDIIQGLEEVIKKAKKK